LRQVCGFLLQKTDGHDITEIMLKVAKNAVIATKAKSVMKAKGWPCGGIF
jgi:hypothetical protein